MSATIYYRGSLLALCLVAGGVHLLVAPEHFMLWWGYGSFFVAVGAFQLLYGAWWLLPGFDAAAVRRAAVLGIAAHLGLIGLYVATRTVGIPPIGPEAGHIEPVQTIDLVSKAAEGLIVLLLLQTLMTMPKTWAKSP